MKKMMITALALLMVISSAKYAAGTQTPIELTDETRKLINDEFEEKKAKENADFIQETTEYEGTVTTEAYDPKETLRKNIYRGFIFDRNMNCIKYNLKNERVFEESCSRYLSNLFGNNSEACLDEKYRKYLSQPNPQRISVNTGSITGQSIMTTIDSELSKEIYEYMEENNIIGSVTVLENDGAVRALVSYPSYDENEFKQGDEAAQYSFINLALTPQRPGSTFKMLSGVLASVYGLTEYVDTGYIEEWEVNNWDCSGYPYASPQNINLVSAIVNSSNCFFAQLFNDLGAERISSSLNSIFRFNEPIECDFGTIENTISLEGITDITRAGFGQRENIPPIYLGMVAQAIVNGGELKKPYMLDKILDTATCEVLEQTGKEEVITVIPQDYLNDVKEGMRIVADGIESETGTVYAKTGTAELGGDRHDLHCIAGAVEKGNGEVVSVVFQQLNSPNAYASGDEVHFQYVLDLMDKGK